MGNLRNDLMFWYQSSGCTAKISRYINIAQHKYKYWKIQIQICHQTDWEFVWCQEGLKINGVDSACSEKNAQQLHFMETTPDTTAVKISEKFPPMQFLNCLVRDTFVSQSLGSDNEWTLSWLFNLGCTALKTFIFREVQCATYERFYHLTNTQQQYLISY